MRKDSFRADFSRKVGSPKRAMASFAFGVIFIIVIPAILLLFSKDIGTWIASLTPMFEADDLTAAIDLVKGISTTYLLFGIPILLLTIPIGFYPEGSWSRLTFKLISGFYAVLWVFMVLGGGILAMDATELAHNVSEGTITSLYFVMDFSGFIVIILGLAVLKNIVPVAEFFGARDEYLHGRRKDHKRKELDRSQRVRGRHSGD